MTEEKKHDWSQVQEAIEKRDPRAPLQKADWSAEIARSTEEMRGVIGKLKARKIERRKGLELIERITSAQFDVMTHQLEEARKVKRAEATVLAERFLAELEAQYRELLHSIGLRNEGARIETLKKLGDQTSQALKELQDRDWPDFMRQETINMVTSRWKKFSQKIMEDVEGND